MDANLPPIEKRCVHFEVCQLPGELDSHGNLYCILHYPVGNKSNNGFHQAIQKQIARGSADFRYVHFLQDSTPPFTETKFPGLADFRYCTFYSDLLLAGAVLPQGLAIVADSFPSLVIQSATIVEGLITITVKGDFQKLTVKNKSLPMGLVLKTGKARSIELLEVECGGIVHIEASDTEDVNLAYSTFTKGLVLTIRGNRNSTVHLDGASIFEDATINTHAAELSATRLTSKGNLHIESSVGQSINLGWSDLNGKVSIRGQINACNLSMASIWQLLDLSECSIGGNFNLERTTFGGEAVINLNGSTINDNFKLIGSSTSPKAIHINGTAIRHKLTIKADSGAPAILIVAKEKRPHFSDVEFDNVDLSECRLVGNSIQDIKMTNIKWAERYGRSVLFDEIAVRDGVSIPFGHIKEASQILKEKYRIIGDNAKAGDFHYSEMEMRRREFDWPKRFLCPEIFYWAFSGYGIGYIRAFCLLIVLVLGFAIVYCLTDAGSFDASFSKALRFSIRVATLQRPAIPNTFSEFGQWAHLLESLWGPVQIALFALALRMRLKR